MDSDQYEELCRHFIAQETGLRVEDVKSVNMPNPSRPGLPEYSHQIDLYWEVDDPIALYLNIANAKWRGTAKVEQGDMLLLQQVRQQTAAHKAFMITNVGFTAGASAAGKDHGIGMHVVTPDFDLPLLPQRDREAMQIALKRISVSSGKPIYLHQIEHRGLDFIIGSPPSIVPNISSRPGSVLQTRRIPAPAQGSVGPTTNRSLGNSGTSRGPGPGPDNRGAGGFSKR